MKAIVASVNALDCGDLLALGLFGEHQARKHATIVGMHGTSSALAVIAAFFGAEQAEPLAQRVK
jgi:hypothetical protein